MKLILDAHAIEKVTERGLDISMFLEVTLHGELNSLEKGSKLIKTVNGTTMIFKKSKNSNTVFIKTGWAKYAPLNNTVYKDGASHA